MNETIIKEIATNLNISDKQVSVVLNLLSDGNTIPFIARYRKEVTGALDEETIRSINEVYEYQVNLLKRKEDVIRLIDEKGMLTDEIKDNIMKCSKLVEVEDIYRKYKEKKKTKATEEIALGLETLAKMMMTFPTTGDIDKLCSKFINDKVPNTENAVTGACYIIAEWISDNAFYRKWIKPHRILALNRGEKEKILTVSIDVNNDEIIAYIEKKVIKNDKSFVTSYAKNAINDAYKRLIWPSIDREIRSDSTEKGD